MSGRRRLSTLALVACTMVVAGCSSSTSGLSSANQSAVTVAPAGVVFDAHVPPQSSTESSCAGVPVTQSLAPTGPLPTPGDMPPGSWMAHIKARGYLIAGVDQNSELWGYRDPSTGRLEGFDVDMVDQVADAIFGPDGAKDVRYQIVANADRISTAENGPADLVAETITINCQRKTLVDFSTEYYDAYQTVLVPKDSSIKSVADLAGKRVCATDSSDSLNHVAFQEPKAILVSVPNQTDCLVMLQQGQVDAISTDDTILEGLAAQDSNVKLLSGIRLSDEPYGMAISKTHPDFTRFVNAVLDQERSDGEWSRIWTAELGGVLGTTRPTPPAARYPGA
jgi:polar amino acid transport system substrate-binding protein